MNLKHGAIENMHMGPMTMAFAVIDKSALSNLKEGSKVKFAVENVDSVPTVTLLVPQKQRPPAEVTFPIFGSTLLTVKKRVRKQY